MRGADLLVAALKAAGVTRIYSLSGNQIMPVYDACFGAGVEIVGPAIAMQLDSTCVILPGETATTDRFGNLIVTAA